MPWEQRSLAARAPHPAQSCSSGFGKERAQPCRRPFLSCGRENRAVGDAHRSWTPCKKPAHCTAARDIPSLPHGSGSSGCAHTKPALAHVTCVCQQLTATCDTTYVCQVFAACLCDSHRLLIFQGSLQLLKSTPDLFFPPSLSPRKPKKKNGSNGIQIIL